LSRSNGSRIAIQHDDDTSPLAGGVMAVSYYGMKRSPHIQITKQSEQPEV